MRILVTGGAGFIGSNFIHHWLKNYPKDELTNLDKLTYAANPASLKEVEDNPRYSFVKGDIGDAKLMAVVMDGVDRVVHFAAESHVDRSITGPAIFVKTNVLGTQVLLEAALKAKVKRFHHVSTDEVFGALSLDSKEKFNEQTAYAPRSPYSATKAASDHLVRAYGTTYGLPYTITNCSNNYGPYMHPEKFIPVIVTNLIRGKKIPIYGDGRDMRDWLYVEDHVRAIELVLTEGKPGETYCVGGMTEGINNLDLAKKIIKLMGKNESALEFVADRPGHDRRYAVDWSKINQELGWKPKHDFNSWLEKTVDWYIKNEKWWSPLLGKKE